MQYLKADTATKVVVGPCVAVGDGFTPVTTLSLSTADEAEILKHDAAAVTSISSNTFAAITSADGYYNLTITAAQLDTEGRLTVLINDDSLCLPLRHDFMVVNANVFDSLFAAATTDYLQVDATQIVGAAVSTTTAQLGVNTVNAGGTAWGSGAITAASIASNAIAAAKIASNAITAAKIATDAITAAKIAANAIGASELAADAATEIGAAVWDAAQASHVAAGSFGVIATEIADILTDTGTTLDGKINTIDTVVDGIQTDLDNATDGLGAIKTAVDALPTTDIAIVTGTADSGTTTTLVDAARTEADTDYWEGDILVITSGTSSGQARTIVGFTPATDTITVEPAFTQAITTNTYRIEPGPSRVELRTATQASIDAIEADTADMQPKLGTPAVDVSADIAAIKTETALIVADTNELQTDWTDGGRLDLILDAILNDTGTTGVAIATGAISTTTFASGAIDAAALATDAVNEIADGILTRQTTESYAADTVAPTLAQFQYMMWSFLHDFGISSTTKTSRKLDNTTAMTHTLDDATNPTDITRAT